MRTLAVMSIIGVTAFVVAVAIVALMVVWGLYVLYRIVFPRGPQA